MYPPLSSVSKQLSLGLSIFIMKQMRFWGKHKLDPYDDELVSPPSSFHQSHPVGGDWNHGILNDFPIILGMENHPN